MNRERLKCKDGVSLSVQASEAHYCTPRVNGADHYSAVEVGYIEDAEGVALEPPESWRDHTDGTGFPASVYAWVPRELVEKFVEDHGGSDHDGILPPLRK
jgi:hypothetical protein